MDAILNWLWQGCLVALATSALLRLLPPPRSGFRYAAWWAALIAVVTLPAVPFLWTLWLSPAGVPTPLPRLPAVPMPEAWWMSTAILLAGWAAWSATQSARASAALLALCRARAHSREFPAAVEARLRCWSTVKSQDRRTRLVVSECVTTAAVLGGGSPLIAVAPLLLESLTDEELDRVVIHEWAHVQRRDDIAHAVQVLAHIGVGWHPAVGWIGRQLHFEREAACDEIAVAITGSARRYAACLTTLAGLPLARLRPLPAPGALSSSSLHGRIVRVLALTGTAPVRTSHAAAGGAALALCTLALVIGGLRLVTIEASTPDATPAARAIPVEPRAPVIDAEPRPVAAAARTAADSAQPAIAPPTTDRRARPQPAAQAGRPDQVVPDSSQPPARPEPSAPPVPQAPLPAADAVRPVPAAPIEPAAAHPTTAATANGTSGGTPASPWETAADAGMAVGRGSQKAAVAAAGFFTRFGLRVAGSF